MKKLLSNLKSWPTTIAGLLIGLLTLALSAGWIDATSYNTLKDIVQPLIDNIVSIIGFVTTIYMVLFRGKGKISD